jgi:hypothetical protein
MPGAHLIAVRDRGRLTALALGLACCLAGGAAPEPVRAATPGPPATLGEPLRSSDADQLALVEHLRQVGAVFYGAWWCPACFQQKNLFGKEAGGRLPYVECAKSDAGRRSCEAAGIRVYPTWILGDGRRVEGVQSLESLRRLSGFSD